MNILALKTDQPEAEIYMMDGQTIIKRIAWQAHRQLAETIHVQIKQLLADNELNTNDLGAIVVYQGPGSFTGLRIGVSVANALAYGLSIPVYGAAGAEWLTSGTEKAVQKSASETVVPDYGADAHITQPKK